MHTYTETVYLTQQRRVKSITIADSNHHTWWFSPHHRWLPWSNSDHLCSRQISWNWHSHALCHLWCCRWCFSLFARVCSANWHKLSCRTCTQWRSHGDWIWDTILWPWWTDPGRFSALWAVSLQQQSCSSRCHCKRRPFEWSQHTETHLATGGSSAQAFGDCKCGHTRGRHVLCAAVQGCSRWYHSPDQGCKI